MQNTVLAWNSILLYLQTGNEMLLHVCKARDSQTSIRSKKIILILVHKSGKHSKIDENDIYEMLNV